MERKIERIFHRIRKERAAYFFLLPLFLLLIIFRFKPLIEGICLSFFKAGIKERIFVGLDNYTETLRDPMFWLVTKNTLFFVCVLVPLILFISLMIALVVSKLKGKLQSFFRAAFYLPVVSAGVVMSLVWMWIFNSHYGIMNYILSFFGIEPILWLAQSNTARIAVCIVQLGWSVGVPLILYLSALAAVPKTIYEAADIDGANPWQKFIKITLPLIIPTFVYLLVIVTIARFQTFSAIFLMTAGGPARATTSIVYQIYQLGFSSFRFGQASTYGTILLIISFVIAYFQFKFLNRKIEL